MSDHEQEEPPLDDEQQPAVDAAEPAIAVLAGPGSGKTRVLSHRTSALLLRDPGSKALLLTFTNKAAAEMKARALQTAVVASDRILASTFHTFGRRILRAHGDLVRIDREFEIIDDEERQELSAEAAETAGARDRFTRWSYLRLRRQEAHEPEVVRFAEVYEQLKRDQNVLDFDDLIVLTANLFENDREVAEAYGTQYPHLLVDEFQDTNAAQFAIVRALFEHASTVSVFADDDQAIYQFAGAEAANVRRFIEELDAVEYPLTTNYRCREEIVRVANRLIAADPQASGRQMRAHYSGGEVLTRVFQSVEQEAVEIADEIDELIESEEARPADISVLTRARFRVRLLLEELEGRGVPVTNWLGPSFETPERRALGTCLTVVRGSLTDRQAERLCDLLGISLGEERDPQALLAEHEHEPAAVHLLEMRELAWQGASVQTIVERAQAAVSIVDAHTGASMTSIVEAVVAFEQHDAEFSLDHLLAELALGGVGGPPTVGGGVKISSLHRTKGLQWPHVYILGLEEGRLPGYKAETDDQIREERRTCFVGVCRAESRLTLTRTLWYSVHRQQPSRFLAEMGLE